MVGFGSRAKIAVSSAKVAVVVPGEVGRSDVLEKTEERTKDSALGDSCVYWEEV
jgi:hypothetical protein